MEENPQSSLVSPSEEKTIIKEALSVIGSKNPSEYMVLAGVSLLKLYENLYRIATHSVVTVKDRDGDVIELGPNDRVQLMASELLLKLAGHIKKDEGGDTNNYNLTVVQRNEIIQRVSRMVGTNRVSSSASSSGVQDV
jgi:hypothetical protein